jgi:hypothetical protein
MQAIYEILKPGCAAKFRNSSTNGLMKNKEPRTKLKGVRVADQLSLFLAEKFTRQVEVKFIASHAVAC